MRKIANVKNNNPRAKRIMIYETDNEVYLFPLATMEDGSGRGDDWYETVEEADNLCEIEYDIKPEDWEYIDDPLEYCQDDWIAPVRIKGRNIGKPEWGKFERLENGIWKEFEPEL